jgi:hypothetical protein
MGNRPSTYTLRTSRAAVCGPIWSSRRPPNRTPRLSRELNRTGWIRNNGGNQAASQIGRPGLSQRCGRKGPPRGGRHRKGRVVLNFLHDKPVPQSGLAPSGLFQSRPRVQLLLHLIKLDDELRTDGDTSDAMRKDRTSRTSATGTSCCTTGTHVQNSLYSS